VSWTLVIPVERAANFPETAKAILEKNRASIMQYNPDGIEAVEIAVDAAIDLVAKGIVGGGSIHAYLSGHGNPEHEAPAGYSKDTVTITLSRTDL